MIIVNLCFKVPIFRYSHFHKLYIEARNTWILLTPRHLITNKGGSCFRKQLPPALSVSTTFLHKSYVISLHKSFVTSCLHKLCFTSSSNLIEPCLAIRGWQTGGNLHLWKGRRGENGQIGKRQIGGNSDW